MSIISTILGVETGGRNITQGNIGDINNVQGTPAQGYFQITDPTWAQFGGLSTGYSSAIDAPYATQLQVAENIPIGRWGPATQDALASAGYTYSPSQTLGEVLSNYGESPSGGGAGLSGSGIDGPNGPLSAMTPAATGDSTSSIAGAQSGDSTSSVSGSQSGQGATDSGPGAPVVITDALSVGSIGANTLASAANKDTSAAVKAAASDTAELTGTATSLTGSIESAATDLLVRGGLVLLAIALLIGAWLFYSADKGGLNVALA